MIALDTNVVVRYLVRDHPEQAETARALLESLTPERPGFLCREVMIETVWVLERPYKVPRARIADAVLELIATDSLVVEDAGDVARAAIDYRQGGAGFADLMILAASGRAGARPLHTFDRLLAREEGATLLAGAGAA